MTERTEPNNLNINTETPRSVVPSKTRPNIAWLVFSLILLVLAAAFMYARRLLPWFAPFYAKNVYPAWQNLLGRFAGIFPFSLSEAILYALPIIIILDIIIIAISKKKKILGLFKRLIVVASILAFLYAANCGVNYYNIPFSRTENVAIIQPDEKLLVEFCEYTAAEINKSSVHAQTAPVISDDASSGNLSTFGYGYFDNDGYLNQEAYYPSGDALAIAAVDTMKTLGETYPSLAGFYPNPKPIFNSRIFSNMGVTGIYSPFTIEANYNREMTPYNIPFTACHELSHLKGYMDEGEANFIGWLACLNSQHFAFNRSAHMMAWVYAGNELSRVNPDEFSRIRKTLPKDAIKELQDNNDFWDKYETQASEVQDQVNNAYLQYNGLEAGIRSYDQVTTLMLSWYSANIR